MKNFKIVIDAGHGGLHPTTGGYVTAGKRMVKDGIEFYEGVNNRINVDLIADALEAKGYEVIKTADTWRDISLEQRVEHCNEIDEAIIISIHSDAHGNGREWSTANGIGTFIYTNGSKRTQALADSLNNSLICNFKNVAKNRGIRKANFYILKRTKHPAVLLELGFHTNKEEVQLMVTDDWRERIVKSVVEAVEEYKLKLK
jgi:N-acetylmuramoyl-L-alanine amidase